MKANKKFVENEAGVSAVIGVILMVAITVAIAATVYVYITGMIGSDVEQRVEFTGILYGFYEDEDVDPILIGNHTIDNVYDVDEDYLVHLIGYNITLILDNGHGRGHHYHYIGAYINK